MIFLHPIYIKHDFPSPKLKLVADKSEQEKPKEDRDWLLPIHLESTCYINLAPLRLIIKIFNSKAVKLLVTLPFIIISYKCNLKNKMTGFMKKFIFGSWPCLTFLAANVLILLSTLQAACSMYNCSKLLATL